MHSCVHMNYVVNAVCTQFYACLKFSCSYLFWLHVRTCVTTCDWPIALFISPKVFCLSLNLIPAYSSSPSVFLSIGNLVDCKK